MVLGLPRPSLCALFSLARLLTKAARKLFVYHFLKETALSFVFWLLEPVQCLGKTFLYLILILKTFRHFKTAEGKTL